MSSGTVLFCEKPGCCCGFEPGPVQDYLGVEFGPGQDLQSCSKPGLDDHCEPSGAA